MSDPFHRWDVWIILAGLRWLTILTFLTIFAFGVWHLVKMFV